MDSLAKNRLNISINEIYKIAIYRFCFVIALSQCKADVVDPTEINYPGFTMLFGLKIGYEFGRGFMFGPEVSMGYIHGTSYKTEKVTKDIETITLARKQAFFADVLSRD